MVNILTVLNEPNYGAQLQAYATYKAVESLGYEPRMIYLSMDFRSRAYSLRNRMLLPVYSWLKGYSHAFAKAKAFGAKSPTLVRDFATDLGFDYRAATDKASFEANLEWFTSPEPYDRPLLLEAFTDEADENASIHYMNTLNSSAKGIVKTIVKKVLPESAIRSISERKR